MDANQLKKFGTDVVDNRKKDGSLKGKATRIWVELSDGSIEYPEDVSGIHEVKKLVEAAGYSYKQNYHNKVGWKSNRGKDRVSHEWSYSVVVSGQKRMTDSQMEDLNRRNDKKVMYANDRIPWYYVEDCLFHDSYTDEYVYLDKVNNVAVGTGMPVIGTGRKEVNEWIRKYNGQ